MGVLTYDQRVAKIHTVDDLDNQLHCAEIQMTRLRNQAKKAGTLAEKLKINAEAKEAESVLRKLRLSYFDIEDNVVLF